MTITDEEKNISSASTIINAEVDTSQPEAPFLATPSEDNHHDAEAPCVNFKWSDIMLTAVCIPIFIILIALFIAAVVFGSTMLYILLTTVWKWCVVGVWNWCWRVVGT